jgi:hypothetical protein
MPTISLKDAKARLSTLVDAAIKAMPRKRAGFVAYLRTFPGGELDRNRSLSRDVEI